MICQTKVTNNTDKNRDLVWAGKNGVAIGAKETIVLEGLYPSECPTDKKKELFMYEVEHGIVSAVLVTDLSVHRLKQDPKIKERASEVCRGNIITDKNIKTSESVDNVKIIDKAKGVPDKGNINNRDDANIFDSPEPATIESSLSNIPMFSKTI